MEQAFLASVFENLTEDKLQDVGFCVNLVKGHFMRIFRELLDWLKDIIEAGNNDRSGQLVLWKKLIDLFHILRKIYFKL